MSTDLTRAGVLGGRDSAVSNAESMLRDSSRSNGEAGQRTPSSFRRLAGSVMGALRFDSVASRTARERGQWAVQQSPIAQQGSPADQVYDGWGDFRVVSALIAAFTLQHPPFSRSVDCDRTWVDTNGHASMSPLNSTTNSARAEKRRATFTLLSRSSVEVVIYHSPKQAQFLFCFRSRFR